MKIKSILPKVALTITLASFEATQAATLIINGSFETNGGSYTSNASSWIKDGAYGIFDELQYGRTAGGQNGSWAYVPGNGYGNTGVYQVLASPLVGGQQYTLSWYQNPWYSNNGNDVIIGVYRGSGARDTASSYSTISLDVDVVDPIANAWNLHSYTFTAVGNSTSIYFGTLTTAGRGDGADIDSVSLMETYAIPEPSAYALFGMGAIGMLTMRKRKSA